MARIRTIKPSFFRHHKLFTAEQETGLPLRLAFAGLWTVADRDGRFEWRPEEIKLDCLPYDDVDFSRVLDALATRGFVVKYRSGTREYGHIPSWSDHQVINNREAGSDLPSPCDCEEIDASATRGPRVTETHVHAQGEGEREGEGEHSSFVGAREGIAIDANGRTGPQAEFEQFISAYPEPTDRKRASVAFVAARRKHPLSEIMGGLDHYVRHKPPDRQWMSPAKFLEDERWTDRYAEPPANPNRSDSRPESGHDAALRKLGAIAERRDAERRGEGHFAQQPRAHDGPTCGPDDRGNVIELVANDTGRPAGRGDGNSEAPSSVPDAIWGG